MRWGVAGRRAKVMCGCITLRILMLAVYPSCTARKRLDLAQTLPTGYCNRAHDRFLVIQSRVSHPLTPRACSRCAMSTANVVGVLCGVRCSLFFISALYYAALANYSAMQWGWRSTGNIIMGVFSVGFREAGERLRDRAPL